MQKTLVKTILKGATVALVVVEGKVLIATTAERAALAIIKLVPGLAKYPMVQKKIFQLVLGATVVLTPIHEPIRQVISHTVPPIQRTLTCLPINYSDYVE